jgi:hypothetical protein
LITIRELTEIKKREENNTQIKNEKDDETTEGKVIAGQNEDENKERKVDEKRDFDIVVSEQKTVSPDGNQIISVRSERRTETIQKEVFTHTRRELKPEEFAMYEKEIEAADRITFCCFIILFIFNLSIIFFSLFNFSQFFNSVFHP